MKAREIKAALLKGRQFGNDAANWYTLINPSKDIFCICFKCEEYRFYKSIDSAAKRIAQLINRGH